jgi:hypothetical protein
MVELNEQELKEKAQAVRNFGAEVKITGAWAWAVFAEKPSDEIREIMKTGGWRWAKQKKAWYLPGCPCRSKKSHSFSYIAEKYGVEDVQCTTLALAA